MGEGAEGYQGVVGGAAAEDFGARVANVRIPCMMLDQSWIASFFPCLIVSQALQKRVHTSLATMSVTYSHLFECKNMCDTEPNAKITIALLTIWLLGSPIIIVQLATQKVEPVFQIQNLVVHVIARTGFD